MEVNKAEIDDSTPDAVEVAGRRGKQNNKLADAGAQIVNKQPDYS